MPDSVDMPARRLARYSIALLVVGVLLHLGNRTPAGREWIGDVGLLAVLALVVWLIVAACIDRRRRIHSRPR